MKRMFYFFKVSFDKSIKDITRYKFNTLMQFGTFYFLFMAMFLGLNFFGQNMNVSPIKLGDTLESFVIGYFMWTVMLIAYSSVAYSISSDASKGTLEQICMSSLGLHSVVIVRSIAELIINLIFCFVILFSIMATTGYWLNIDVLPLALIIVLGIFSIFGLSLVFGGLAIVFKQVNSLLNLVQYFLIGFVMFDINLLASAFIPFRPAANIIYYMCFSGANLLDIPLILYLSLIFNSVFYFIIGLIVFNYCSKIAKKKGLLGQY